MKRWDRSQILPLEVAIKVTDRSSGCGTVCVGGGESSKEWGGTPETKRAPPCEWRGSLRGSVSRCWLTVEAPRRVIVDP